MIYSSAGLGLQLALATVKTLILIVGGSVTYLAFSAYRRTYRRSLGLLSVGFGLIVIGVSIAGITFEVLNISLGIGILIESLFVLLGLSTIAYSLRIR